MSRVGLDHPFYVGQVVKAYDQQKSEYVAIKIIKKEKVQGNKAFLDMTCNEL